MKNWWLGLVFFCGAVMPGWGGELSFRSGEGRVAMVELFTSEGCSSCPAAEAWMSRLADAPGLWSEFVPMAWHVDYWDGLGWPDRFAKAAYTARQRSYAAQWRSDTVYTPGLVLDGREWRAWSRARRSPGSEGAPGVLEFRAEDEKARVVFKPASAGGGERIAHVALLGADIESKVKAGENRGRTLRHDFVVLEEREMALTESGGVLSAQFPWPEKKPLGAGAVAVWVSRRGKAGPVQATGGWLAAH